MRKNTQQIRFVNKLTNTLLSQLEMSMAAYSPDHGPGCHYPWYKEDAPYIFKAGDRVGAEF